MNLSAFDWGSKGREFKSLYPDHFFTHFSYSSPLFLPSTTKIAQSCGCRLSEEKMRHVPRGLPDRRNRGKTGSTACGNALILPKPGGREVEKGCICDFPTREWRFELNQGGFVGWLTSFDDQRPEPEFFKLTQEAENQSFDLFPAMNMTMVALRIKINPSINPEVAGGIIVASMIWML